MNLNFFESKLINKIKREKNPIAKPMSKTTQREFLNVFESKQIPSNLCQFNKNKNNYYHYNHTLDLIIFRKKKQRMYWSTQMNEFLKNTIENSNLDYKAIVFKFISLNKGLNVAILQIVKHINIS